MHFSRRLVQCKLDLALRVNKLDAHTHAGERVDYAPGAFDLGAFGADAETEFDVRARNKRVGSVQEKAASADVVADEDFLDTEAFAAHVKRFPVALAEASFNPNFHGREKPGQEPCGSKSAAFFSSRMLPQRELHSGGYNEDCFQTRVAPRRAASRQERFA